MRRLLIVNYSQERVYDNKKGLFRETDIDCVSIQQLVDRQDARPFDRRTDSEYLFKVGHQFGQVEIC